MILLHTASVLNRLPIRPDLNDAARLDRPYTEFLNGT
jgi:hypothetical protein